LSQWSPLSEMYIKQRTLRFADGPDEVHHHVIPRAERQAFENSNDRRAAAAAATAGGTLFEGP
ncbi:MAG: acyl-CoA dehydrogenase, partial [Pseudodonghicola sp.]